MTQKVTIELEELKRLLKVESDLKMTPESKDVVKSIDKDKRLFTALTLRPDEPDAHGHVYNEEVVEKACHNFNEYCRSANLQHLIQTDAIVFVESFIVKADHQIGGVDVFKGDWIQTARIDDDDIWAGCLDGTFTGFSIGATATIEEL